ncbi:MAG TPA: G-D-S-L family lipolytic protein [Planctomycetaceae bacterium]|nr:G-D-S-L family lipolytic protein [Planctomycetaceae bacterium]
MLKLPPPLHYSSKLNLGVAVLAFFAMFADATRAMSQTATETAADAFEIPTSDDGLPGDGTIRRYGWFKNLWRTKRSSWAKQVTADQGKVVFLGDSITQGWQDDFRGLMGKLPVANRGISGDTTRGMLIRLEEDVLAVKPRCVVMLMGTNDLDEGDTPEQIAGNFKLIIDRLKKHDSGMPIVVCEVFPSSPEKNRPVEKIRAVNNLYKQAVKGDPQITVVDTWTLFANEKGDAKPEEFPDLLHPNQDGYNKWAAALKPIFATLGFIETTPAKPNVEPGFRLLFNGDDLTGWCVRPTSQAQLTARARWLKNNPAAPPWPIVEKQVNFDGKKASPDGRFESIAGRLVVKTPSEGRRIQQLSTQEEFPDDFTLRLEFRCTPNADSGVFLRGKQLQCRDFPLAGPYKDLKKYRPGDWNKLEVIVTGTQARCLCNGEVLEEALELPETGPIGLEGDRGQLEYRFIRVSTH